MKTPVFVFWHSFYDETTILHNKILQQATDLLLEVSPTSVLSSPQKASIVLLSCLSHVLSLELLFPLLLRAANGIFLISTVS